MTDLEDRVRRTLHGMAAEVPRSQHAMADLDRRLARRGRGRRPVLVIAAAAVVVAAVAVPVALNRADPPADPPAPHRVATDPPGTAAAPDTASVRVELGQYTDENDVPRIAEFSLSADGGEFCIGPAGATPTCEPAPTWPTGQQGDRWSTTRQVLGDGTPDSGPLPGLMVFVTAPHITELEARRHDGMPVQVRELAATDGARYFLAGFGHTTQGFGYTAYDAQGNVVESAIT